MWLGSQYQFQLGFVIFSFCLGNTAERFFAAETREKLVGLVKCSDHDRELLKIIHMRCSVILRVISSGRKVHVVDFNDFCYQSYEFIVKSFPWVRMSPTVHALLAHAGERILINDGYGLKSLSEQGLEGQFLRIISSKFIYPYYRNA